MFRPTTSWLLPTPFLKSRDLERSMRRASSLEPAASTTTFAVTTCTSSFSSTYFTPVSLPLSSTSSSVTIERMRRSQFPLLIATGITEFCEPFLASIGHWNPTQKC